MKALLFFTLSLFSCIFYAQNPEFKAVVSRKSLGENERLRIEFIMNKDGDNFSPPSFAGFDVVMGPSQSVSHSIINGKRSFSKSFSFILQPKKQGKIIISEASIEIEGNTYKTQSVEIQVTEPVKNPQSANQNHNARNPFSMGGGFFDDFFAEEPYDPPSVTEVSKDDVFIAMEVSNPSPYLNEPIFVSYKMMVSENFGVNGFEDFQEPSFLDFLKEEIEIKHPEAEKQTINGKKYHSIEIKKLVLYPQKSQDLTISPLSVKINLQIPTNVRDIFGRTQMVNRSFSVNSPKRTINVKKLPEDGKPENFSGAVGEFSVEVTPSKNIVKAGESMSVKTTLLGKGNFKTLEIPSLNFPASIEVYPKQKQENLSLTTQGLTGSITETYTIVPENSGKFLIHSVPFSFFNPKTQKYESVHFNEFYIEVEAGKKSVQTTPENQEVLKETFKFIKTSTDLKKMNQKDFFGSVWFYILWFGLLFSGVLFYFARRYFLKTASDLTLNKQKLANKLAKKYLGQAQKNIGQKQEFYESLEKGLLNFLKARLKIETSQLNKEKIFSILKEKNIENDIIEDLNQLLSNCEMARYTPYSQNDMQNDYQKAVDFINSGI